MRLKLKRNVFMLMIGALMVAFPLPGRAMHLGGATGHSPGYTSVPAEDILHTLHNLSSSKQGDFNPNLPNAGSNSAEVCVFCHTPHGANLNAPGSAPLWNRTVGTSGSYTIYNSPNFDAQNSGQPQGVSLACLSCHDGTVALDSLINMSGSGGYRPANLTPPGSTTGIITANTAFLDVDKSMSDAGDRTDTGPNYELITGGARPFPNLTTNLSDDHPISMEIPTTDPQFDSVLALSQPDPSGSGMTFLTRTGVLNADKRDRIRAYPGATRTPGTGKYIECASCHNPHAPRPLFLRLPSRYDSAVALVSGGGTTTVNDLLGNGDATLIADNPNAGSLVCLSCHQK